MRLLYYVYPGYVFSGCNTKADGTGTSYTNGQSVSNLSTTNGATVTLYAKWTASTNTANYIVKHYVHNLGTNTYTLNSTDSLTGTAGTTLTLANLKKTISGFTYVNGFRN